MQYDPWQLLAGISMVLIGLSAACLLSTSCDFHDHANFAQCLLPSLVWITGMGLSSGLSCDFRVSRPLSQLAPLLAESEFLAIPWNPTPLFIKDADPGADASLL